MSANKPKIDIFFSLSSAGRKLRWPKGISIPLLGKVYSVYLILDCHVNCVLSKLKQFIHWYQEEIC